jgi:nitrogen fixation/metabolism regulation signal transduction histidine kinase
VHTIVDQVDAMKRLVNEFRDYARLPAAELKPVDLNELVTTCCTCTRARATIDRGDAGACAGAHGTGSGLPAVLGDAQQLRQVIHNLLQNAQDATEGRPCARC